MADSASFALDSRIRSKCQGLDLSSVIARALSLFDHIGDKLEENVMVGV